MTRAPMTRTAGSPNFGAPPELLFSATDRLGIRWVSYDRQGYGGATPGPGRGVADALSIDRCAVMGWLREHADRD
jgi:hypothetical protein